MLTAIIFIIVVLALVIEWDCHLIRSFRTKKIHPPFRYGSRVQITKGGFRDLYGKITSDKCYGEWQVRIETGDGRSDYAYKYLPEHHLRLIESSYSIWIDDGFVSERYSSGYETEVQAARICAALQITYRSLCYKTTFTERKEEHTYGLD